MFRPDISKSYPLLILMLAASVWCAPATKGLVSKLTGRFYPSFNCTLCEMGVSLAETMMHWHVPHSAISSALLGICEQFHIEDKTVCSGAIAEFSEEVYTVLGKTTLAAKDVCVLLFGDVCPSSGSDPQIRWDITLPNVPRPPDVTPSAPSPNAPRMRVLHLADLHIDTRYTPGANADCGEPLCCQDSHGVPANPSSGAGFWGDYRNCDLPDHTLDNLLSHLATNEQFDVIYWTGDLPPHNVWNQSRVNQLSILQYLTSKLIYYFPKTPIFPAIGNHESAPVDSFPPPFINGNQSESWLYSMLATTWSHWLPPASQQSVSYAAFYTVLLRPGFRIISLNSNFCNRQNFWLLLNATDPAGELQWLVSVLQAAEFSGEKVHIIGHIPPGTSDCFQVWSENYVKIIVRYSNTIAGQFFGHTHYDHFMLMYNPVTQKPVSTAFIAPSVTPYSNLNPGYRVYTMDGFYTNSSWVVLDHETRFLDLTLANTLNITKWQLEYSALAAYNLTDMLPSSLHNLSADLKHNSTLFSLFYQHYFKMRAVAGCDSVCRDAIVCSLRMATYGDSTYCEKSISAAHKMHEYLQSLKAC